VNDVYVLDACALIAVLTNEPDADAVKNLLQKAMNGEIKVSMHKVNFLEVYYHTYKLYGEPSALNLLGYINMSPIEMDAEITDDILIDAGRLKSLYKISLADSIPLDWRRQRSMADTSYCGSPRDGYSRRTGRCKHCLDQGQKIIARIGDTNLMKTPSQRTRLAEYSKPSPVSSRS